jgi:hypothetical protein
MTRPNISPGALAALRRMIKTATVSRDMKQYRRALQAFNRGDDYAFHGTRGADQSGILQSGQIYANPGVFGTGAYFSSRQPSPGYWGHGVGVIAPIEKAVEQGARVLDPKAAEPWLLAPEGYRLQPKDMFVHSPTRLTPRELRRAQVEHRIRPVDTKAYHLAEMVDRGHMPPSEVSKTPSGRSTRITTPSRRAANRSPPAKAPDPTPRARASAP